MCKLSLSMGLAVSVLVVRLVALIIDVPLASVRHVCLGAFLLLNYACIDFSGLAQRAAEFIIII